jgi:serine/threonine-protein kinase
MVRGRCAVCGVSSAADPPTIGGDVLTHLSESSDPDGGLTEAVAASEPARTGGLLQIGQNFGTRYHIIRLLGTGGMGAVYQAWDQVLEVAVAVKVVRPQANDGGDKARDVERRFKRELVLARQVTHKHVVRIHDLGEIDGITYITMPYVQGSDLATILRADGRLPVDRVLVLAKEIASGLAAARRWHRPPRSEPANIMVDADGHALIMDFGIARSTKPTDSDDDHQRRGRHGEPWPRSRRAARPWMRADIYSFGLISTISARPPQGWARPQ